MRESKWVTGTADAATTFTVISGYSIHETAGAAAVVSIRDTDVSGTEVIQVNLAANASETESLPNVRATAGQVWFVDVQSGTVEWPIFGW